jgi:hypothetical protein
MGHGIERVDHGEDSARDGDLLGLEPVRIAGAVAALVMTPHHVQHGREQRHGLQKLDSPLRMPLDGYPLVGRKGLRLLQNSLRHADLSDVVQEGPSSSASRCVGESSRWSATASEAAASRRSEPASVPRASSARARTSQRLASSIAAVTPAKPPPRITIRGAKEVERRASTRPVASRRSIMVLRHGLHGAGFGPLRPSTVVTTSRRAAPSTSPCLLRLSRQLTVDEGDFPDGKFEA